MEVTNSLSCRSITCMELSLELIPDPCSPDFIRYQQLDTATTMHNYHAGHLDGSIDRPFCPLG